MNRNFSRRAEFFPRSQTGIQDLLIYGINLIQPRVSIVRRKVEFRLRTGSREYSYVSDTFYTRLRFFNLCNTLTIHGIGRS